MTNVSLMRRAAVVGMVAALVGLAPVGAARAGGVPASCAWRSYGHDAGHSFSQPRECSALSPIRAARVVPTWFVKAHNSVTSSPALVGGVVYVGDWDGVFRAISAANGKVLWKYAIGDRNRTAFGRIESSPAVVDVAGRRVVVFGGGATLYALDAANGRVLAAQCLDPRDVGAARCQGSSETIEIESSPAIVKTGGETRVVVGMDVHNASKVGRTGVVGLRLAPPDKKHSAWSLLPLWKYDPEANASYTGPKLLTTGSGTGAGCAGVWSSPAVDTTTDMVFFGTSSCSHDGIDTGESLYGVRLSTGKGVWAFHPHRPPWPSQRWDDDFGASPNLLPSGMVGDGSKDGTYYALDRKTGKLRWATAAGAAGHLFGDFAIGGMIGSAATGYVNGQPAIFATTAISTPLRAPIGEKPLDVDPAILAHPGRLFSIHAIRAKDGAILWRSPLVRETYGPASFVNGVVLVSSTLSSSIDAFNSDTGLPIAVLPVLGPPSSTPVVVGSSLVIGGGTSATDLEFKAFGGEALEPYLGQSPTAPLSGISGYRILPEPTN